MSSIETRFRTTRGIGREIVHFWKVLSTKIGVNLQPDGFMSSGQEGSYLRTDWRYDCAPRALGLIL